MLCSGFWSNTKDRKQSGNDNFSSSAGVRLVHVGKSLFLFLLFGGRQQAASTGVLEFNGIDAWMSE
jgi:hypothetical protein